MTEQEVLDRMLSAYWLIDEFEDLSGDVALDLPGSPGEAPESHDPDAGAFSLGRSGPDGDDPDSSAPDEGGSKQPDPELEEISAKLDRIAELLADENAEESEERREGSDAGRGTLDDRLDALDDRTEALADTVDRLRDRIEELDRETPDASVLTRLQDAVPEVAREVQQLREDHGTLRTDISEDFGHIERILRHLLDKTDELEDSLEAARSDEDRHERSRVEERLTKLKRTASAEGIRSARCDECDGAVDLGVLPEPRCPHCGAEFLSLEPKSWLFGSNTLSVRTPRESDRREPLDSDREESTETEGPTASTDSTPLPTAEPAEPADPTDDPTTADHLDGPEAPDDGADSVEPDDRTTDADARPSTIANEISLSDDIRPEGDDDPDADRGPRADIADETDTESASGPDASADDDERDAPEEIFDWDG